MGGFLHGGWLAGYEERDCGIQTKSHRAPHASHERIGARKRAPEIVASLQVSFDIYLEFAVYCGAIDSILRHDLSHRCWQALCSAAEAQQKHQIAAEPTARFLDILRSCLVSGRAHFQSRDGGKPEQSPEDCGWRRDEQGGHWSPRGDCIGWVDGDDVFLEPATSYRVIQIAGRESGEALAVSEQTLKKRLHEKRLLASVDTKRETLTIRRTLGGSGKHVLHFSKRTILFEPDGEDSNCRVFGGDLSGAMSGNQGHPTTAIPTESKC